MADVVQEKVSGAVAACLERASSFLAACSRPALDVNADSTLEQLSSELNNLVSAAELFGCKPSFWRWTADAAKLLGRVTDADTYHQRFINVGKD